MRFLSWLWLESHVAKGEAATFEVGGVLGPQGHHQPQVCVGARASLVRWHSQGLKLVGSAPCASAEDDPPLGEHAQSGQYLGYHQRIAVGDDDNGAAQLDSLGEGRCVGQGHKGIIEGGTDGGVAGVTGGKFTLGYCYQEPSSSDSGC